MLAEKWRFYVMAESKSPLLIDSLLKCIKSMQSIETTFAYFFFWSRGQTISTGGENDFRGNIPVRHNKLAQ